VKELGNQIGRTSIYMKVKKNLTLREFSSMPKLAVLVGISVISLLLARPAAAQESLTSGSAQNGAVSAVLPSVSSGDSNDYKSSLRALSTLYQNELQKLEKHSATSRDLYKDGLISRVEMEASDKALTDARARVDQIAAQIAEASKPAAVATADNVSTLGDANAVWTTGSARIDGLIQYYGSRHGVDPFLIYCLMSQESKFTSGATSPKGAQGLMQLMPGTAARYGVTNPYDMSQNISGGTRYLKDLLEMFKGRVDLALAGYNAGEGAVMKYGYTIPPYEETRNYVKLIVARYGRKTLTSNGKRDGQNTKRS